MWIAALLACFGSDEPVVSGVRDQKPKPTVEEIAAKREREELRASPRILEVNYEKPAGVYADVQFLGGRRWENVREIILDQLGAIKLERPNAQGNEVKELERGTVTLVGGLVETIEVPLPEPMRRSDAMVACGFLGLVDKYLAFNKEYRVTQFQGFRRIVLHRAAAGDDMVDVLTGYHRQERIREIQ